MAEGKIQWAIKKQYKRVDNGQVVASELILTEGAAFDVECERAAKHGQLAALVGVKVQAEELQRKADTLAHTDTTDRRNKWEDFTPEEKAAMQRTDPAKLDRLLADFRARRVQGVKRR
jgi:hypothetical protein